mgnify:CR=1 FL=1
MKKIILSAGILLSAVFLSPSCKDAVVVENKDVNRWIYSNMDFYYLWNDKITKSPNYGLTPDKFFNSLLYKFDKTAAPDGDRFSWIESNYRKLLESLSGVSSDEIGFEYIALRVSEDGVTPGQYYLLVTYPMKGTDAYAKGLKRGNIVLAINDQEITSVNASQLLGGTGTRTLSIADWVTNPTTNKRELRKIYDLSVQMQAKYAENPIYLDTIYNINGMNIGYLVYNFFARDKGDGSHNYDKELMDKLQKFQGVSDLVLDLRYNSGGTVFTAIGLASALMKDRSPDKIFGWGQYNPDLHRELVKYYKDDKFNVDYFVDKMMDTTAVVADVPQLNLSNLYVLTGKYTASASELVINGLKPYMNIVLVGDTTYGKNVGSVTIYDEDSKKTKNMWGLQPIVVRYYNSANQSDYTNGFVPQFPVDELADFDLVDFGDITDPLLNKALTEIAGPQPVAVKRYNRMKKATPEPLKWLRVGDRKEQFPLIDDRRERIIQRVWSPD